MFYTHFYLYSSLLMCFCLLCSGYKADKIKQWPGQPSGHDFVQYSGYVTINATSGKQFFYVFLEAQNSPETKPLVLWLNGGPGCSSVWNGFFLEHGPWRVKNRRTRKLTYNPFSWNLAANMLYLESPAGVGFSYSKKEADYESSDDSTARDNLVFLNGWVKKFPRFKNRTFYITGESYAGHYIPQLATKIVARNGAVKANGEPLFPLRLKGLLIGNPALSVDDGSSIASMLFHHFIISKETYLTFLKQCIDNYNDTKCMETYYLIAEETGYVDPYDLNGPVCQYRSSIHSSKSKDKERRGIRQESHSGHSSRRMMKVIDFHRRQLLSGGKMAKSKSGRIAPSTVPKPFSVGNPACADHYIYRYMNNRRVQKAIHANVSGVITSTPYLPCSDVVNEKFRGENSVLHLFKGLFDAKLQIWILSGDADTVVPFTTTLSNVEALNMTVQRPYFPWYYYDQPGGSAALYKEGLTLVRIRNAGHLIPIRQPERALYLFRRFLLNLPPQGSLFGTDFT